MATSVKDRIFKELMNQREGIQQGGELKKALTTSGDGAALLPYDLDPVLHEELLKLQPLAVLLDILEAGGKTHEYNVRSSHPQAWFEGELTPANQKNSVYQRKTVQTKIQRIWGGVSGFAQSMDEAFIDALSTELEGSLEGMANTLEFGIMWGAASDIGFTGDPYQYSGLIPRLMSYAPGNVIDAGGNKVTLDDLDRVTAKAAKFRGVRQDPKLWIMGSRMRQIVDGLQTAVQIPLENAVLEDGKITMNSYDGIPILESDFIVPEDTSPSPSDLAGAAAAGGALSDGVAYDYRISSVTMYGEQEAAAATGSAVTPGAGDNTVNLTWTADANAVLYMIWRNQAGGDFQLLDIIPAYTYDAAGTVNGTVAAYTDDGSRSVTAVKPLESDEHNIFLANYNSNRGAAFVGKVDDMGRTVDRLFNYVELARVKDSYDYMLKGYLTARLVHPNLVGMVRHAKFS